MATVIFDLDSTLLSCESLEEILHTKLSDMTLIKKITNQGMSGEISFIESLEKRLALAKINKQDVLDFKYLPFLTPGMEELIADLKSRSVEIWIISGAMQELLLPLGNHLGIPKNHLMGITLNWSSDGEYQGIDPTLPSNRSKWEGAKLIAPHWSSPVIGIGDGVTDYALFEHGLVDHFIAFTQHARRDAVISKKIPEARTVEELREEIEKSLKSEV